LYYQQKKRDDPTYEGVRYRDISRHDPELIKIYYELGNYFSAIKINKYISNNINHQILQIDPRSIIIKIIIYI